MQSAFLVELEYVSVNASQALLGTPSLAVKTSMSAGVSQNTKEIHLKNASLSSLLWQTSAPTNPVDPMQFVLWANVSVSQDSRGTLRTQERAASHPPAPTTLTVATMRSASL